jgi:hypothetical protein
MHTEFELASLFCEHKLLKKKIMVQQKGQGWPLESLGEIWNGLPRQGHLWASRLMRDGQWAGSRMAAEPFRRTEDDCYKPGFDRSSFG